MESRGYRNGAPATNPISLFDLSAAERINFPQLYARGEECVEPGCLLYAGGDHELARCHSGLCLAIELSLQKHEVAYEVFRGDVRDRELSWVFNGSSLGSAREGSELTNL